MISLGPFRSRQRQVLTDEKRKAEVDTAIARVIADIDFESQGLRARLAAMRERAGTFVDNEVDDYLSREAGDNEQLESAERQLRVAYERLASLDALRLSYGRLRDGLPAGQGESDPTIAA